MPELENKTAQRTQSLDTEFAVQNDTNSSAKSLPAVPLQLKTNGEKLQNEKEQHSMPTEESFLFASPSTLPPEDSKSAGEKPAQGKFKSTTQFKKGYAAPTLQFKSNPLQLKEVEEEESLQAKLNPMQLKIEEEEEPLQQKVNPIQKNASEEEEVPLQKKSDNSNGLPAPVQTQMEGALGADFSNVNIHTNSQSATDVGALAYTQGNDVHFAPGQYNPESSTGQELIGHELTHVVQQREGRVQPTTQAKGLPVNDDKGLEDEADAGGRKAVQMKGDNIYSESRKNSLLNKNRNTTSVNSTVVSRKVIQRDVTQMPQETIHSSRQGVEDARQRARTAADVKTRALGYITRHQQLVNEAVENFKVDAQSQITAMDGDPSDMWGLIPTLVGTAAAVVGTIFPPAAIGAAIVAGIQAAIQTTATASIKSERGDAKDAARATLNSFALSVSNRQAAALANIERALDTTIEEQLLWDYDLRDLMLRGDSAAIDDLCSRIHVPNPTTISPFARVLRGLTSDFARWMARQAFHREYGGTGFWDMVIDTPGTDLNREMRHAENEADRQAQQRSRERIREHDGS